MSVNPEKFQAAKDWEQPTNVKEVRSSLGFLNYNWKFIQRYSKKTLLLINLTIEKNPWQWNNEQKTVFQELKNACCAQPVLKMFDPKKPIQIKTDAFDLAIGACLSQEHNKQWHPIAYLSRKFLPAK